MEKNSVLKRGLKLYSSFNPKYFPMKFAALLLEKLAPFFTLWMSAELVSALYEGRSSKELFLLVGITLLGNLFLRIFTAVFNRQVEMELEELQNKERLAWNAKTISMDYDRLENPETRRHRKRVEEHGYINSYGVRLMRILVELTAASLIEIVLALLLLMDMVKQMASVPLSPIILLLFGGFLISVASVIWLSSKRGEKLSALFYEVGSTMQDINRHSRGHGTNGMDSRIYKQQVLLGELFAEDEERMFSCFTKAERIDSKMYLPIGIMENVRELCSYLIICFYCVLEAFPVGSIIKYIGYFRKFTQAFTKLLELPAEMKSNEVYLEDYLAYFDIPNDMYQGSLSVEKRSDKQFDIQFKNVSFRYAGSETDALKNINLDIQVGEKLAVVGMNGSGKTTFIKLMCRLYDPSEGEILMNDFNVRKYDYKQYLDLFSVVFQDYKLLSVPLGNNIAAAKHWDKEKAESLLEEIGFGERLARLEKGLETPIYKDFDEEGVNISGGEAQKLALARALYKEAPFIILDEPTAALDPIAEAEIYSKFDKIVGDKTAIYISHRLSSCRFCDKIAVFDKGEIVQLGIHEELLQDKKGKYYELWNAQAHYYQEQKPVIAT